MPMRQSDALEMLEHGALQRPGPLGRLVRFGIGADCLYSLCQLMLYRGSIIGTPVAVLPDIAVVMPPVVAGTVPAPSASQRAMPRT